MSRARTRHDRSQTRRARRATTPRSRRRWTAPSGWPTATTTTDIPTARSSRNFPTAERRSHERLADVRLDDYHADVTGRCPSRRSCDDARSPPLGDRDCRRRPLVALLARRHRPRRDARPHVHRRLADACSARTPTSCGRSSSATRNIPTRESSNSSSSRGSRSATAEPGQGPRPGFFLLSLERDVEATLADPGRTRLHRWRPPHLDARTQGQDGRDGGHHRARRRPRRVDRRARVSTVVVGGASGIGSAVVDRLRRAGQTGGGVGPGRRRHRL